MKKFILALMTVLLLAVPVMAQQSPHQIFCTDYSGFRIQWVPDGNAALMVSSGYSINGIPVIRYNESLAADMSPTVRQFFYHNECARLVLGFKLSDPSSAAELLDRAGIADCWVASRLYYSGKVNIEGLNSLQEEINVLPRTTWKHLPTPIRVVDLTKACHLK